MRKPCPPLLATVLAVVVPSFALSCTESGPPTKGTATARPAASAVSPSGSAAASTTSSAPAPTGQSPHKAAGVQFDSPVPLPGRASIGTATEVIEFVSPKTGPAKIRVLVAAIPEPIAKGGLAEVRSHGRATFLGNALQAKKHSSRKLAGGATSKGDLLKTSIPRPGSLEAHAVELSPGKVTFVGFWFSADQDPAVVEKVVSGVMASLKTAP